MTTSQDTTKVSTKTLQATKLAAQLHEELLNTASEFVTVAIEMNAQEQLSTGAAALWNAGGALLGRSGETTTLIGQALMLEALIASPAALVQVAVRLRALLVESDPALALLST